MAKSKARLEMPVTEWTSGRRGNQPMRDGSRTSDLGRESYGVERVERGEERDTDERGSTYRLLPGSGLLRKGLLVLL